METGNMHQIQKLDEHTSRALRKEQVITGVADVVRELVENAIDAGAKRIQVHLDNYGMKRIEVRDDGHGIPTFSLKYAVDGGYSSKASKTGNLSCDDSYGFRGEALSGICSTGNLSITTKSSEESHAICAQFDPFGRIKHETKVAHNKGTNVVVTELFGRSPVRCKYLNTLPQLVTQLRDVEQFLKTVSIINHQVHFTLAHNGNSIWTKPSTSNLEQALCSVWGVSVSKQLQKCSQSQNEEIVTEEKDRIVSRMELFVPKLPIDRSVLCSTNKMTLVYVNRKAVCIRKIEKVLKEHICSLAESDIQGQGGSAKYPVCVLIIEVSPQNVDFNLDLDKRKVFLVHKEEILEKLKTVLEEFYSTASKENQEVRQTPVAISIPNIDSVVVASSPKEKQNNIMNFLNEIPVAEPLNFTRSPSKVPQDSLALPGDGHQQPNKHLILSGRTDTTISRVLNNGVNGVTSPLGDKNRTNSDVNVNDKEWVHGRMTDGQGNIIQSAVLVRADPKPTLADDGLVPSRPTRSPSIPCNITTRNVIGSGFPSSGSRPAPTQLQSFGQRYDNDNGGPPPKKMRQSMGSTFSSQSQTPKYTGSGIGRSSRSEPRQVTLQTFRNWPQPTNAFAKTNVVHSITQPSWSQPRSSEKVSKCPESSRNTNLHGPPPKNPVTISLVEPLPRQDPSLVSNFLSQREMLRTGTLGLRKKVPVTPQIFRQKERRISDENEAETAPVATVIGKLGSSEPPLYVVKIATMLGVLSPVNLLEMEPTLKSKLNSENMDLTNNDFIQALAGEFSQLSYEDYEETQVKRVFTCLKDFNEEEPIELIELP